MKLVTESGKVVDRAYFNAQGLDGGDRNFEGVWFEVTIEKDKIKVDYRQEDEEYLSDFNIKKFLKLAREILEDEYKDRKTQEDWFDDGEVLNESLGDSESVGIF